MPQHPDIFISYAREDRSRVEPLVKLLEVQGWSVWFDKKLRIGGKFDQEIEDILAVTKCVLVLWSEKSIKSEWVREEANYGKQRNILVPAKIDLVEPPLGFQLIHAANLTDWKAGSIHSEFNALLNTISSLVELDWRDSSEMVKPFLRRPSLKLKARHIMYAILAIALTAASIGIYKYIDTNKRRVEWGYSYADWTTQWELQNERISSAASLEQLEELAEKTRKDHFLRLEELLTEGNSLGIEFGSSKEMMQTFEELLQTLIEERQKELNDLPQTKKLSNAYDMEFVYLPPGTFIMGSPNDEPGHMGNETQHEVTLSKGIYIQNTEVTYEQWENIMGTRPSFPKGCDWECPIQKVSWNDADEFIDKLNKKLSSNQYRLPTETEWEYAARAGSESAFANGGITEKECGHDQNLDALGWYCGNSNGRLHSVGEKEPNKFGLYDMHGNVWEWCKDRYSYNYPSGPVTDPIGPKENSHRVVRGGSWLSPAMKCRAAYRLMYKPTTSSIDVGFRLVLDPNK